MKKHPSRCLVQCVLGAWITSMNLVTFIPFAHAAPPIQLGEVAWAGGSLSSNDEWLEIWNTGTKDQSLRGWKIVGASDKPIFFPNEASLPARSAFLISNYSSDDPKSVLAIAPQMVTSSVSLSNTSLHITLIDGLGNEIDVVGDGHAPAFGSNSTAKASMIHQGDLWITAATSSGFDAGRTDMGTPGICDGCLIETIFTTPESPTTPTPTSTPISTLATSPTSSPPISDVSASSVSTCIETTDSMLPPTPDVLQEMPLTEDITPIDQQNDTEQPADPIPEIVIEPDASSTLTEVLPSIQETTSTSNDTTTNDVTPNDPSVTSSTSVTNTVCVQSDTIDIAISTQQSTNTETIDIDTSSTMTTTLDLTESTSTATSSTPLDPETEDASQTLSLSAPISATPPYELLRLNKIMPQPESGPEWVDITNADPSRVIPLANIHLADGQGVFYTFATGTLDVETTSTRIFLKSSRLNNDGDVVRLLDPLNRTLDIFTYAISFKGEVWERRPDVIGSWETNSPQPLPTATVAPATLPNTTTASNATPSSSAGTTTPTTKTLPPKTSKSSTTKTATNTAKQKAPLILSDVSTTTSSIIVKKAAAKTKTPATKKTTAKTTTKSSTKTSSIPLIHPFTFDMVTQDPSQTGIRVALQGIVGSAPGLLGVHQFVLLASDGRGLLIHAPSGRKLPDMHESIHITGTLAFTDTGTPELNMHSYDSWTSSVSIPEPLPRIVNLLAPSTEDEWSLVNVTGTISAVHTASASLDLGDLQATLDVKSTIGYRINRLKVGDVIRVAGLLKTSNGDAHIIPRSADDIVLVGHPVIKPNNTASPFNGWLPFAAAGAAVAGTEGTKRLRSQWQKRRLRAKLEEPITTTS